MGRIITQVTVTDFVNPENSISVDALVDTGAAYMTLPSAWKSKFGAPENLQTVEMETATGEICQGEIYGPVRIQVANFREIYDEVLFIPMEADAAGKYEPLLGYVVLEKIPVAVDMLGHRLVKVRALDLK
jgi:predicted aspartyl protease